MRVPTENSGICVLLMNGNTGRVRRAGVGMGDRGRANILIIAYLLMKYDNFQNDRHNLFPDLKNNEYMGCFFLVFCFGFRFFIRPKRTEDVFHV